MIDFLKSLKTVKTLKERKRLIREKRSELDSVRDFQFGMAICSMLQTGRMDRFDAALERAIDNHPQP